MLFKRFAKLKNLPISLQYLIALLVVAVVVAAAWLVGREAPVPLWITRYLVPVLTAVYLALLVVALVSRWRKRK